MPSERDLPDLLPPSPPPRPDRRETAIGAALQRFDGGADGPLRAAAPPRRWLTGRPQFGLLVAAALVAAIGLPLWLSGEHQPPGISGRPVAADAPRMTVAPSQADISAKPPADTATNRAPPIVPAPASRREMATAPSAIASAAPAEKAASVPPSATVAPPPAPVQLAAPAPPPAPAPAPLAGARYADEAADTSADVVVTGMRVTARAKQQYRIERGLAERGDWNRCTIDDPRQDADACRAPARAAVNNSTTQATALVGDGLTAAWHDDLDGATTAFDHALSLSPRLAAAWLNRGLTRAKVGDDAGALADLDKAVRYAPRDARGWFQRSLILRRLGKTARAEADARHAAELDPRYEDVID